MSMTRKYFEGIAYALKQSQPSKEFPCQDCYRCMQDNHRQTCLNIAYKMRAYNSRFDMQRFMAACGYQYDTEGAFYHV